MKGNRFTDTVREYVRRLTDDDLRYLHMRLTQRVAEDVGEAVEFLQQNADVDHWLGLSKSATELFEMIDVIDAAVGTEAKRRSTPYEQKDRFRN